MYKNFEQQIYIFPIVTFKKNLADGNGRFLKVGIIRQFQIAIELRV